MSLTEAQDPKTPTARLLELFQTHKHPIKQALAQNPSTPHHILMQLANEYPHEFLQNPVLPMLLLEDPNLLHKLSPAACADLIKESSEAWVLRSLACYPDAGIRFLLCTKQDLSTEVIALLLQDPRLDVRNHIAQHPLTPKSFLEEFAKSDDEEKLLLALHSPGLSLRQIESLAASTNPDIREALAVYPQCPPNILEALLQDPNHIVRTNAASNPATPSHALLRISRDLDPSKDQRLVLYHVAENPNAPLDALFHIAFSEHFMPRSAALRSTRFGSAFVMLFLQSPDEATRVTLATRRGLTYLEQERLCEDENEAVRESLVGNRYIDPAILRRLAQRASQIKSTSFFSALKELAANPNTPEALLEELSLDESLTEEIARNPSAPGPLLARLAKSKYSVRLNVAGNTSTPEETLQSLFRDDDCHVRFAAKRTLRQRLQPSAPETEPEISPDEIPGVRTVQDLVHYLATHPDDELRARIKAAPHTPELLRNALR